EDSAALQNVEGFVHMEMSVDGDACTNPHLLCPQGEIVRTRGGANFDEDVPVIAKMNEMFTFSCAEHVSLRRSSTDLSDGSSYSGCACGCQKATTATFDVHGNSLGPLPKGASVAAIMNYRLVQFARWTQPRKRTEYPDSQLPLRRGRSANAFSRP